MFNLFEEVVSPTLPEASTAIPMRCQVDKQRVMIAMRLFAIRAIDCGRANDSARCDDPSANP